MIEIRIPGFKQVTVETLVLDFNGTPACDGVLAEGARDRFVSLSRRIESHILSKKHVPENAIP